MSKDIRLFTQKFNINNREITGTIEKSGEDMYIVLYDDNNKEIKRTVYNNELDDNAMIAEMENLIEY